MCPNISNLAWKIFFKILLSSFHSDRNEMSPALLDLLVQANWGHVLTSKLGVGFFNRAGRTDLPSLIKEQRPVAAPSLCGFYSLELERRTGLSWNNNNKQEDVHLHVFTAGHSSQGVPQALPREQQQEALETPTPISLLQAVSPLSPRGRTSKQQFPERVSIYHIQTKKRQANSFYVRAENSNPLPKNCLITIIY